MDKPNIPNRWTRMRAGEFTFSDLSNPEIQRAFSYLRAQGYDFDAEPDLDGGMWIHCNKSPNRVTTIGEEK